MYKPASTEPEWLALFPGVRARFAPIGKKAIRAAKTAAAAVLAQDPQDVEGAGDAFSAELIRAGLLGWEGIADATGEQALAFDPAGLEVFLGDPALFEAADEAYVGPYVARQAEKNGYALSPAGTSAGATPDKATAATAGKPAPTARTKSTPRRRTKAS
jgi:hypothetical protein